MHNLKAFLFLALAAAALAIPPPDVGPPGNPGKPHNKINEVERAPSGPPGLERPSDLDTIERAPSGSPRRDRFPPVDPDAVKPARPDDDKPVPAVGKPSRPDDNSKPVPGKAPWKILIDYIRRLHRGPADLLDDTRDPASERPVVTDPSRKGPHVGKFHPVDKIVHTLESKVGDKSHVDGAPAKQMSPPSEPKPAHELERRRAHCKVGCPCGLVESEFCKCKVCREDEGRGRGGPGPEVEA